MTALTETRPPEAQRPVALVTGASGGMGSEIVRALSSTHTVIAVGRDGQALASLNAETGCTTAPVDLADPSAIAGLAAGLTRLDVLVHAAAIARPLSVENATVADWRAHFDVDVVAPAELTRLTLPLLRTAQGTVVFVGSGASTRPVAGSAVYTAAKHALRGLADVLRIDEEPYRIRVVTIAPGQTDTRMLRAMLPADAYDSERYIRPQSIAEVVRFVVDAPADVHLTDIAVRPRQEIARL
ncbi:NADP-dependent 3-hydroxy acid dehydrogenase YdfG [Microbacterium sp. W4I4]|uniref:SDR family oxidoreductase n=1 Tax=Microbacterium sp. W4I4 TaxID=3042295 RepID=UPI00278A9508|nr:SDR family oxidoreductase [Microbacterium sp. W4I4]MDQ0612496.1 NADP-dependent 3-hydroxy acid dehydrogenase YdfG [Microbacterium sp. W4I4]